MSWKKKCDGDNWILCASILSSSGRCWDIYKQNNGPVWIPCMHCVMGASVSIFLVAVHGVILWRACILDIEQLPQKFLEFVFIYRVVDKGICSKAAIVKYHLLRWSWRGVNWVSSFSIHLSVCGQNRVHSVWSSIIQPDPCVSYLHMISSTKFRRYAVYWLFINSQILIFAKCF